MWPTDEPCPDALPPPCGCEEPCDCDEAVVEMPAGMPSAEAIAAYAALIEGDEAETWAEAAE